jgi:hypothetical protein
MTRGLEEAKHEQGCFQWRIGSEMETIKKPVFTQVVEGEEVFEKDRPTALNIMNPQMELETLSINQTFRMNKFALISMAFIANQRGSIRWKLGELVSDRIIYMLHIKRH